jgi:hypothetical protein
MRLLILLSLLFMSCAETRLVVCRPNADPEVIETCIYDQLPTDVKILSIKQTPEDPMVYEVRYRQ